MSFLGGLGRFAQNAAAPLADTLTARNVAAQTEREKKRQQDLQAAMLQRQASIDDDNRQLHQATIGHLNAETTKLGQPTPRNIDPLSQEGITATVDRDRQVGALKPPAAEPLEVTMSGGKRVYTPRSKAVGQEAPSPSQDDHTLVLTQDPQNPDGPGIYVPRGQAAGQHAPAKPKAENATNVAATARLQAAVSEMNNAHSNMSDYEQRLSSGQTKINAGSQVLARVANAFTHDDPMSQLTQSGALAMLNQSDPDLARYIRRGLSFAEGESMVSQRPSDFRTKMAAFLSTAASGASPEMIHDIQGRRTSILNPLNTAVAPGKAPTSHAAPGTLTPAQMQRAQSDPEYKAYLQATGKLPPGGGD